MVDDDTHSQRYGRRPATRRGLLKTGAGLAVLGGGLSVGSARTTAATSGSTASTTILRRRDRYNDMLTEYDGQVSLARFYTDGPRQGALELVELGDASSVTVSRQTDIRTSGSSDQLAATTSSDDLAVVQQDGTEKTVDQAISQQSLTAVERSADIDRDLGTTCGENYCQGFDYEHRQTGVTFELTKAADLLGDRVIAQVISALASQYGTPYIGGLASILAAAVVGLGGKSYTVSPWDHDYDGWVFSGPEIMSGVGLGWDLYPANLTVYNVERDKHLSWLWGSCG